MDQADVRPAEKVASEVDAPPNSEPEDIARLIERMSAEEVRAVYDLLTRREESA